MTKSTSIIKKQMVPPLSMLTVFTILLNYQISSHQPSTLTQTVYMTVEMEMMKSGDHGLSELIHLSAYTEEMVMTLLKVDTPMTMACS